MKGTFDGTGTAAAWLPTVQIVSDSGVVMAQVVGSSVAAGGSATATFATFLEPAAAAAATASFDAVITQLALTNTLIGKWRLGEGAAPYLDTSGYGVNPTPLTIQAGTAAMTQDYTPGALPAPDDDGAVQFNGQGTSAEYLNGSPVGDSGRFNFGGGSSQTIAAFVRPLASGSTFLGGITGEWANAGTGLFMQWPARTVIFQRRHGLSGTTTTVTGPALTASAWTFVAATYSTANGHRLYVNGALVASDPATNTPANLNLGWWIGNLGGGVTQGFYGAVDEVSAWLSELTAADIASLAAAAGF